MAQWLASTIINPNHLHSNLPGSLSLKQNYNFKQDMKRNLQPLDMFRTCTELRREPLHKMVSNLLACYYVRGCSLQSLSEFQSPTAHSIVRSIIRFFPRVLHYQLRNALVSDPGKFSWRLILNMLVCQLSYFTSWRVYQSSDFNLSILLTANTQAESEYAFIIFLFGDTSPGFNWSFNFMPPSSDAMA